MTKVELNEHVAECTVRTRSPSKDLRDTTICLRTVTDMRDAIRDTLAPMSAEVFPFPARLHFVLTVHSCETRGAYAVLKVFIIGPVQMFYSLCNIFQRAQVLGTFTTFAIILADIIITVIVIWIIHNRAVTYALSSCGLLG